MSVASYERRKPRTSRPRSGREGVPRSSRPSLPKPSFVLAESSGRTHARCTEYTFFLQCFCLQFWRDTNDPIETVSKPPAMRVPSKTTMYRMAYQARVRTDSSYRELQITMGEGERHKKHCYDKICVSWHLERLPACGPNSVELRKQTKTTTVFELLSPVR